MKSIGVPLIFVLVLVVSVISSAESQVGSTSSVPAGLQQKIDSLVSTLVSVGAGD